MSGLCIECGKRCSGKRCMDCFKKTQEIRVGTAIFVNKKELNLAIKIRLQELPRNIEVEDKLLITVINQLHEDVKKRNFKVTKLKILDWDGQIGRWEFCRDRFRGGVFVVGYFEPINEWHGVTVYPHKRSPNQRQRLILALRQKWSESIKRREPNAKCVQCGNYSPQLHHDSISFREIVEECMNYFSEKEIKEGIGDDWWLHEQEADAISDDHPAVMKMLELHNGIKYRWLCRDCHKEER